MRYVTNAVAKGVMGFFRVLAVVPSLSALLQEPQVRAFLKKI